METIKNYKMLDIHIDHLFFTPENATTYLFQPLNNALLNQLDIGHLSPCEQSE